jgi:uncharacterized protein (TIRG00374 family)
MKKVIHYSFIIGLLLFLTLLFRIDYKEMLKVLGGMKYSFILVGLLLTAFELLFKTMKLQKVVGLMKPISFRDAMKVYLIGLPYGAVTPGKVGDVVKLYTLHQKTGMSRTDCVALGLVERLLEMIALVFLAGIGVFILIGRLTETQFISLLASVVLMFLVMMILLNQKIVHAVFRPVFYMIVPKHKQDKPRELFYQFYEGIEQFTQNKQAMIISLVYCVMGWIAGSIRTYYFAQGLGITGFGFIQCLFLVPLVTVIELLPISVLGVGTRDYALISLFSLLGISHAVLQEQAVSLSMLMLVVGGIPPALIGYAIALKEHIRWKDVESIKNENGENTQG